MTAFLCSIFLSACLRPFFFVNKTIIRRKIRCYLGTRRHIYRTGSKARRKLKRKLAVYIGRKHRYIYQIQRIIVRCPEKLIVAELDILSGFGFAV